MGVWRRAKTLVDGPVRQHARGGRGSRGRLVSGNAGDGWMSKYREDGCGDCEKGYGERERS